MKTTLLTRLLASVVLVLGLTVVNAAPIPLEEVKVGSTVTGEGIGIGWGKGDYYPVPKGNWEVTKREDREYGTGAFAHSKMYIIQLLNKDKDASLQIAQLYIYPENKNRQNGDVGCKIRTDDLIRSRLGTGEGQNFQLCKSIRKPMDFISVFDNKQNPDLLIKQSKTNSNYLIERFNSSNPKLLVVYLASANWGDYRLIYNFGFKYDDNNVVGSTSQIDDWLTSNANLLTNYYRGEKITLLDLNLK